MNHAHDAWDTHADAWQPNEDFGYGSKCKLPIVREICYISHNALFSSCVRKPPRVLVTYKATVCKMYSTYTTIRGWVATIHF